MRVEATFYPDVPVKFPSFLFTPQVTLSRFTPYLLTNRAVRAGVLLERDSALLIILSLSMIVYKLAFHQGNWRISALVLSPNIHSNTQVYCPRSHLIIAIEEPPCFLRTQSKGRFNLVFDLYINLNNLFMDKRAILLKGSAFLTMS